MLTKGYAINSSAVDRILERVQAFSAREDWEKAESLLDKLLFAKPWDSKLLLCKAHLRKRMWIASNCENYELLKTLFVYSPDAILLLVPPKRESTLPLSFFSAEKKRMRTKKRRKLPDTVGI